MKCTTTLHSLHIKNVNRILDFFEDFSFLGLKGLLALLLVGTLTFSSSFSQRVSPYRFSKGKTLGLTLGTLTFSIGSQLTQNGIRPLSLAELKSLDRMQIPAFERSVSYNWNLKIAKASDLLLIGSALLPVTLLALKPIRDDLEKPFVLGIQALTLTYGITGFAKALVRRNRPFTYINDRPGDQELLRRQQKHDARFSFFSGHTSVSAASSFFTAKMFNDYYPDSPAKPFVWAGAALLPAVIGLMRVKSGKHFPSDVIAGYLVGGAVGFLIPHLHKTK